MICKREHNLIPMDTFPIYLFLFLFLLIIYFTAERENYYKHVMKARRKYLSFIMDAMDQAKTMIPHFTATPKFAYGMWKLKTYLLGAIIHYSRSIIPSDGKLWKGDMILVLRIVTNAMHN